MQGEAIYKGATRPAMKLGIPLVPLVVLFGTGMLLIMWGGTLVSWWIALGVVVAFVLAVAVSLLSSGVYAAMLALPAFAPNTPNVVGLVNYALTQATVAFFLVSFVLYYFINWKYLSTLWALS